jgi:predicted RNase H-like nuclease
MRSILAIDPAWTARAPSGVALLTESGHGWTCVALAPSYAQFSAMGRGTRVDWSIAPPGGLPVVPELLDTASLLLNGAGVDLVTIDMPIAMTPITARRAADAGISRRFGGVGCSTHTPSATRPGRISDLLRAEFADRGYPLATATTSPGATPAVVEVYPHPALLVLMKAPYRLCYKVSRARRYWPALSPSERRSEILRVWREIYERLAVTISGAKLPLPTPEELPLIKPGRLKSYEDAPDALICGWVGIQYLEGRCSPYGDETAAIWTP